MPKKIFIILLLGLCFKAKAQVTSTLTQITTDLLKTGIGGKFNWADTNLTQNLFFRVESFPSCTKRKMVDYAMMEGFECVYTIDCFGNLGNINCTSLSGTSGGGNYGPGSGSSSGPSISTPTPTPSGPPPLSISPPNPSPTPTGGGSITIGGPKAIEPNMDLGNDKGGANVKNFTRTDTLNPILVNCDSIVNEKSQYLLNMMSVIDTTPEMKKIRDSSELLNYEIGFTIRTLGSNPPYKFKPYYVDNKGTTQNVPIITDWYSVGAVHLHPKIMGTMKGNISPSPQDCAALLNLYNEPRKSKFLSIHAVFPDSLRTEIAIMVDDTLKANQYVSSNVIANLVDTAKVKNGTSNPQLNNWIGDINNPKTLAGQHKIAVNNFIKEGYPLELTDLYAQIYMLHMQNIPIKMYNREADGTYKQLNFTTQIDAKGITHFLISKCN